MNSSIIVLRAVHIVSSVVWVGTSVFLAVFFVPAVASAGPDGARVLAALQRRRFLLITTLLALSAIVSGMVLMHHLYGGMPDVVGSRTGMALMIAGVLSLVAFVLGIIAARPSFTRGTGSRATVANRVTALLLVVAAGLMAVARYL